jgi:hypothetical protein
MLVLRDNFQSSLFHLIAQKIIMSFALYGCMANHPGLLVLLLFVAGHVLISGCTSGVPPVTVSPTQTPALPSSQMTTPPSMLQYCTTDNDCVPAECCHPTSCINRVYKGACTMLCTDVCQGPIDCGAGRCGCVNMTCSVIASGTSDTPVKYLMP